MLWKKFQFLLRNIRTIYLGSFVAEEQKQIKAEIKTRMSQLSLMVQ